MFRAEYGRAVAVLVRVFGDIDIAEEAVADAFTAAVRAVAGRRAAAEPGRLDHHHRAQPGDRPAAPRGVARRPPRAGGPAARPRRADRGGARARRAAAADLHLLPPGARPRRAGRPHPAAAGRADHRGDRAGLPRAGADHGAAAGARQGQDPRREDPLPRARRGRARPAGCSPCSPSSTSSSTRATRPARGPSSSARTCAPRPSASAGCSSSSCPTSRRCWGCSR